MTDSDQGIRAMPGLGAGQSSAGESTAEKASTSEIKQKLSDDVRSASKFVQNELSDASEQVQEVIDGKKNFIAGKVSGIALAVSKVADELEIGDDRDLGKLARSIGASAKSFSDDIEGRSLGEIAGIAEDFGRKQPLAFLGLAAIAGLAASRFLTASTPHGPSKFAKAEAGDDLSGQAPSNANASNRMVSDSKNVEERFDG
ncbi:nutrient deprivation-induced protein [Rhizobium sp. RM]|uniref:nutrient deprivation-induced protein n=1 Tax=Rhizobium sp. RM TaxID=2748079 RepID=UPI00110D46F1|nr:nutrient deprivation-induced protein [Rhizobium sp. RM]NWJ27602.1 nutrient deprivation-induced protein [Rhizobium sp. RM]TMV19948.1 nutrient deprivation-induced protein [Rhizobium sp. Td3]